jgi:hypothetical protein
LKKNLNWTAFLIAIIIGGLFLGASVHFGKAQSGTNVSGIISSDTIWAQANSPYTLIGNVLVNNNVTLTVESGTTVNINTYYIMVNGTLNAVGNNANPITLNGRQINIAQYSSNSIIENAIVNSQLILDRFILTRMVYPLFRIILFWVIQAG